MSEAAGREGRVGEAQQSYSVAQKTGIAQERANLTKSTDNNTRSAGKLLQAGGQVDLGKLKSASAGACCWT